MTTAAASSSRQSRSSTNIIRHGPRPRSCSDNARQIADLCGRGELLLEYGAGAGVKTEIVLGALEVPQLYVPIDIAADFLDQTAARMRDRFPRASRPSDRDRLHLRF